jgi:hypothetical protein
MKSYYYKTTSAQHLERAEGREVYEWHIEDILVLTVRCRKVYQGRLPSTREVHKK